MCVCVCVCKEREGEREIDFKELVHEIVGTGKSGVYRTGYSAGDSGQSGC